MATFWSSFAVAKSITIGQQLAESHLKERKLTMENILGTTRYVNIVARTIIVDCTKSIEEMIADNHYNWVHYNITVRRFPIACASLGEWECDLYFPNRLLSSESVLKGMKSDDKDNLWIPARLEHILAFDGKTTNEQYRYPIVALGSVGDVHGNLRVPYLSKDIAGKRLCLGCYDDGWLSDFRFLRVRKAQKP